MLVGKIKDNSTLALFNKAVYGVLTQGRICVSAQGSCEYRASVNGEPLHKPSTACAVGHIITDEVMEKYLDGASITLKGSIGHSSEVKLAVERSIGRELLPNEIALLVSLQDAHDESDCTGIPMYEFAKKVRAIAIKYALTFDEANIKLIEVIENE